MKKTVLMAGIVLGGLAALAEGVAAPAAKPRRSALIREAQMRRFGGMVVRPDAGRGRIAVIDATAAHGAEISRAAAAFAKELKVRVEVARGKGATVETAAARRRESGAEAAVFVVEDAKSPTLLVAPEESWAIVNASRLADGRASREVLARRVRCEVCRALSLVAGAANSTFPKSLMSSVSVPADLDRVSDEIPPAEVFARMPGYLKGIGITPVVTVPYSLAVQEGWAPAPTNEYQKAIWDKVHALPTEPIRIRPETKKVAE